MTESRLKTIGLVVTILVHGAVIGGVFAMNVIDQRSASQRSKLGEDEYEAIQAGLAIRAKSAAGKTRSKLPQKDMAEKVKPDVEGVAMDPNKVPPPKKPDDKQRATPDMVDPSATFNKFRKADSVGKANTTGEGADDENVAGKADGSEWGTLEDAKGDPYAGELAGRVTKEFDVPSLVGAQGLKALGCVRLNREGRIVERSVEMKSGNPTFDRAVDKSVAQATDMEAPVPDKLVKIMVKKSICFEFKL